MSYLPELFIKTRISPKFGEISRWKWSVSPSANISSSWSSWETAVFKVVWTPASVPALLSGRSLDCLALAAHEVLELSRCVFDSYFQPFVWQHDYDMRVDDSLRRTQAVVSGRRSRPRERDRQRERDRPRDGRRDRERERGRERDRERERIRDREREKERGRYRR